MCRNVIILFLLVWNYGAVQSVRIVELRMPTLRPKGGSALLDCRYEMEGDTLYSVKLYKDGREFYRYLPKNDPAIQQFPTIGVVIDESRSSSSFVRLKQLTPESAGMYKCEVSGEAPHFTKASSQKYMDIHLLPKSGPHITGQQDQYYLDEQVSVNCTSAASRPTATLRWFVNDLPAPQEYLRGPWEQESPDQSDVIEKSLELRFIVQPAHFVNAKIRLKCQATIAPLYQMETTSTHYIALTLSMASQSPMDFEYSTTDFAPTLRTYILPIFLPILLLFLVKV